MATEGAMNLPSMDFSQYDHDLHGSDNQGFQSELLKGKSSSLAIFNSVVLN